MPRPKRTSSEDHHDEPSITIAQLGAMSTPQIRSAIAQLKSELAELLYAEDGSLRDLGPEEHEAKFSPRMRLLDQAETHLQIRAQVDRGGVVPGAFGGGRVYTGRAWDFVPPEDAVAMLSGQQVRDQAMALLEERAADLPAAQQQRLADTISSVLGPDNPYLDGEYVARRTLITESEPYRSAFQQILTEPHPLLTEAEVQAVRAFRRLETAHETRAMAENANAGLGVPTTLDPTVLLSSGAAEAPLLAAARVVPVTSNVWKGISSAPPVFIFQTEAAATTDGSPTLTQPTIVVHMSRAVLPYSIELGQDYPNFATEMSRLLQAGWTDQLAAKTINGSGSGEPYGILTRLDATTTSEVVLSTNSSVGGFTGAAIFNIWNQVPERFRSRARWLMSVSVESQIRGFSTTTTGQASSYFTVDLAADGMSRLNGRPILVTDYAPTYSSTTGHANHLIVGDLAAGYTIAMRQGLNIEPVPLLFSTANPGMPTGQRGCSRGADGGRT